LKVGQNRPEKIEKINVAVLGNYLELTGHDTCCAAVNRLVVIPNRIRMMGVRKK